MRTDATDARPEGRFGGDLDDGEEDRLYEERHRWLMGACELLREGDKCATPAALGQLVGHLHAVRSALGCDEHFTTRTVPAPSQILGLSRDNATSSGYQVKPSPDALDPSMAAVQLNLHRTVVYSTVWLTDKELPLDRDDAAYVGSATYAAATRDPTHAQERTSHRRFEQVAKADAFRAGYAPRGARRRRRLDLDLMGRPIVDANGVETTLDLASDPGGTWTRPSRNSRVASVQQRRRPSQRRVDRADELPVRHHRDALHQEQPPRRPQIPRHERP